MSTAEKTTAAPTQHHWLRIALAVVALIELADALSSVHNIFTDYHHPTALLRFAQALTSLKLALAPLVAGAAAVLAVRSHASGHLRTRGPRAVRLDAARRMVDPVPRPRAVARLWWYRGVLLPLRLSGRSDRRRRPKSALCHKPTFG